MNRLKIGFRVESGSVIGTGHLMEVISLIKTLREKIRLEPIVITNRSSFAVDKLKEIGIDIIKYLPEGASEKDEIKQILNFLKEKGCAYLIMDLLQRSNAFYRYLNKHLKSTCVILDNSEHKGIPAKIVVNFSIAQHQEFYKNNVKMKTKYLIGPKYFPIDQDIKEFRPIKVKKDVDRIFVNQGGGDPYGLTLRIVNIFRRVNLDKKVDIIIGGTFPSRNLKELSKVRKGLNERYKFYLNISQKKLFDIMTKSDMAITAAGNTLYELAYLGIPSIVICHHEKHNRVAKRFSENNAVINLGIGSQLKDSVIADTVKKLILSQEKRMILSRNMENIVDGQGCLRLANEILKEVS